MTKMVVTVGFLVAFAAGLVVGIESRDAVAPATTRPSHHGGWLAAELNLTARQQEQLKAIWSETASRGSRERDDRRRQFARQRDEAIAALIRSEDKARYDEILNRYSEQLGELDREWRSSFQSAVERTKEILTPEQRAKYEILRQHRQADWGARERHRGEGGYDGGRRGERGATSRAGSEG